MGVRKLKDECCEFCVIIYPVDPVRIEELPNTVRPGQASQSSDFSEIHPSNFIQNHLGQPMLVHIVEVAEQPQQGRQFVVPSIIRLYPSDHCPHRTAESLDTPFRIPEALGTIANRELEVSLVERGILPRLQDSNSIDKLIEHGSQIVETVGSNCGEMSQGRGVVDVKHEAMTCLVGITLSNEAVGSRIIPGADFILDSLQVFMSPCKFESTSVKNRVGKNNVHNSSRGRNRHK